MVASLQPLPKETQEMLNKTRTIIITLIAAMSVVSVGPMTSVASALPKGQGPGESAQCLELKHRHDHYLELAQEDYEEGWIEKQEEDEEHAFLNRDLARGLKCPWATVPLKVETPTTNQGRLSPPPVLAACCHSVRR
jgi:hypothetical protein